MRSYIHNVKNNIGKMTIKIIKDESVIENKI